MAQLVRGETPRERALEVFSRLRIWDTEDNCGVLIYLLLADRDVEIVADRGIHRKVGDEAWQAICRGDGSRVSGRALRGRRDRRHRCDQRACSRSIFRASDAGPNELPDAAGACCSCAAS